MTVRASVGLRIAVRASLLCAGSALALLAAGVVVGSLFFDDPHASYADFLAWFRGPALTVAVATGSCLLVARWLSGRGHNAAAVAFAACPVFVILGGAAFLVR